MAITFVVSQ